VIVMPANATGWFWHCLARETGRIGHLYSPGAQRGPWPWFPFALDNKIFSYWDMETNTVDLERYEVEAMPQWLQLLSWAAPTGLARWAIVRDVPGNAELTLEHYERYHRTVADREINPALAVQDGMTPKDVRQLKNKPTVICVGGTTEWKWETAEEWIKSFPRVHVLRCNSPEKLYWLESLGAESCDGTGWNRGDRKQTEGLETWARQKAQPKIYSLTPHVCRKAKHGQAELFAI